MFVKHLGGDTMENTQRMQEDLLFKEQRVSFWEKHHRLMPKRNELSFNSMLDDHMAEFQDK